MKYLNLSYQNEIEKIISDYPNFKVVEKADESIAHEILESQGMQLLENLRLSYSRRPDLWKSFEDSNQRALIFFEHVQKTAIGAVSEGDCYYLKKPTTSYYTSDLRLSPKTSMRVRRDFREFYQKFINILPTDSICTTAILKDNIKAMNAFTRGSSTMFYNEMFEYLIRTIVILPGIFFNLRRKIKDYEVVQLENQPECEAELNRFIHDFENKADFSNNILKSRELKKSKEDEFIILKDNKIEGYFSLLRPISRSIFVQTTSVWMRMMLKLLSLFSRSDLSEKLPWVYITSMVFSDELKSKSNLLSLIIMELRHSRRLKTGELLLMIHPKTGEYAKEKDSGFILKCPQVISTGVIFRVEPEKHDRSLKGQVHIDPSEL